MTETTATGKGTSVPDPNEYDSCANCKNSSPIDYSCGPIAGIPAVCTHWCNRTRVDTKVRVPVSATGWCTQHERKAEMTAEEVENTEKMEAISEFEEGETISVPVDSSHRAAILSDAHEATCGQRDAAYGDPSAQLGLAGALKNVCTCYYDTNGQRVIPPAEREALDMVLTKLSRAFMGPKITRDTYVDMAAYAAIAGQCALENEDEEDAT